MKNQKKNKKYAALTLLGNSQAAFPKSPQQATLEAFPNPNVHRDFSIRIDCPDFTSLCPVTGQPDFAEIFVEYIPDERCLETKSLKLYLDDYRMIKSKQPHRPDGHPLGTRRLETSSSWEDFSIVITN